MKPTPRLLAALALTLGASLALAQEERPKPPGPPDAPNERGPSASPPQRDGSRGERRESPRPPDRERRYEGPRDDRGEHRPDSQRRSEGLWNMPVPPPKPTRYLGVVTSQLPPELAAQLGLAEGFGLLVNEVVPESPAAVVGVQKWDVLTRFNDQQLVSAEQFATLVRAQAKDAETSLTLLRKSAEQKVTIKVGEKMMPERRSMPSPGDWQREMERWKGPATDAARRLQEKMKEYGEKMRDYEKRLKEFQERMKNWQKNPGEEMPQLPPPPAPPESAGGPPVPPVPPSDILREVRPGGQAEIRRLQPQGGVVYNTGSAKFRMKDEQGEIEISNVDGKRVLVAKSPSGETIFDGPIETEEQRAALPESVREKIKRIDVRVDNAHSSVAPFPPPAPGPNIQ